MPIDESEWEHSNPIGLEDQILHFLQTNSDKAFDELELAEEVNLFRDLGNVDDTAENKTGGFRDLGKFLYRLRKMKKICDRLVNDGEIERRQYENQQGDTTIYYRAVDE